jgi:hypothetical protein
VVVAGKILQSLMSLHARRFTFSNA